MSPWNSLRSIDTSGTANALDTTVSVRWRCLSGAAVFHLDKQSWCRERIWSFFWRWFPLRQFSPSYFHHLRWSSSLACCCYGCLRCRRCGAVLMAATADLCTRCRCRTRQRLRLSLCWCPSWTVAVLLTQRDLRLVPGRVRQWSFSWHQCVARSHGGELEDYFLLRIWWELKF